MSESTESQNIISVSMNEVSAALQSIQSAIVNIGTAVESSMADGKVQPWEYPMIIAVATAQIYGLVDALRRLNGVDLHIVIEAFRNADFTVD